MDNEIIEKLHQCLLDDTQIYKRVIQVTGWGKNIIKKRKIGFKEDEGRIIIPIYDELQSVCLNALKYKPKMTEYKYLPYETKEECGFGRLLYPLDQLENTEIIICGGPKDVLNVIDHWGIAAICNTTGETNWDPAWNEKFAGINVIISYDNDVAGNAGAIKVAEHLYGIAASVKILINQLPYKKEKDDLSDLILNDFAKQDFLDRIAECEEWRPRYDIITLVERNREDNVTIFEKEPFRYIITRAENKPSGLMATIALYSIESEEILYRNHINLSKANQRKGFELKGVNSDADQDLIKIEDLLLKIYKKELTDDVMPKQAYIITEKEKAEALGFLKNTPHLLKEIVKASEKLEIIGEEINRLIIYLTFTSRLMNEPLSLVIMGQSSSGKSYTSQRIMKLIPPEGYRYITRATAQAFFHLPEDGLEHKIVFINELPGSEAADYAIRSAISEKKLILAIPIKDPATGDQITVDKTVRGPCGFLITTTKSTLNHENETRNLNIYSDDTPEQTKRTRQISIARGKKETKQLTELELTFYQNVQRMLKTDLEVIIPFAEEVFESFPDKPVRVRRDVEKFRVIIEVITVLHQFHREKIERDGKEYLLATVADYQLAKIICEEMLFASLFQLPKWSQELYDTLVYPFTNPSKVFDIDDVVEETGWEKHKIRRYISVLVKHELVEYVGEYKPGVKKKYKMTDSPGLKERFLIKSKELIEKYPCDPGLFYHPFNDEEKKNN